MRCLQDKNKAFGNDKYFSPFVLSAHACRAVAFLLRRSLGESEGRGEDGMCAVEGQECNGEHPSRGCLEFAEALTMT